MPLNKLYEWERDFPTVMRRTGAKRFIQRGSALLPIQEFVLPLVDPVDHRLFPRIDLLRSFEKSDHLRLLLGGLEVSLRARPIDCRVDPRGEESSGLF